MKNLKGILGVILLLVIDQVSKLMARNTLQNKKPFVIIKNVFELNYLENTGAAFGILKNQLVILVILTLITLFIIGYVYVKLPETGKYTPMRLILVLLSAGAVGNLIDRVLNNYVVDFLYFKLINFPVFNIADCYITISAILLFLFGMFYYKEDEFAFLKFQLKNEKDGE